MKAVISALILCTSLLCYANNDIVEYDYETPSYSNPYCYIHNNNPRQCNATPGCRFISGSTSATCNGRPGFPPSQTQYCAIHNNNPKQCQNTPFCQYTLQPDQCISL